MEDELDDADSVKSSSSLLLSSMSSNTQEQINKHQTLISTIKSISPKYLPPKTTLRRTNDSTNKLDTKENILNQKPRQPSNHRNGKIVNSTSKIQTDVDLKPVVRRAAANKASDKIAKDSAALNRKFERSFSTSTSDASSENENTLNGAKHPKKKQGVSVAFSTSSNSSDSCDINKDKPIAKQKHQHGINLSLIHI